MSRRRTPRLVAPRANVRGGIPLGVLIAALAIPRVAGAAGGHHAVDDAAMLDPGQCQVETWFDRASGNQRTLLHVGPACRVAAIELGLSLDRASLDGSRTETTGSAQIKWAREIGADWNAGVVLGIAGQSRSPHDLGSTLVVPVTWQVSEKLLTHFNVGRDFRHGHADTTRAGLALEWTPWAAWSFVAERFREGEANFWRTGARWYATPSVNVDLGYARGTNGSTPAWWTLGLTWAFDR